MPNSVFIRPIDAFALAHEMDPFMTVEQIRAHADDGGLLLPHGCKLTRRQQGAVRRFVVSGYAHDGSDLRAAIRHLSFNCDKCEPMCRACGSTRHPTWEHKFSAPCSACGQKFDTDCPCGANARPVPCVRCGHEHATREHAKTNGTDYFCTWCGDRAPALRFD